MLDPQRARALAAGHPPRECGAADHDRPYRYLAPDAEHPLPVDRLEYARLLVLRGRAQDGAFAADGYTGLTSAATSTAA